jgi:hypothetical protein
MMLSHGILKVQETTKHSEALLITSVCYYYYYYYYYYYITSLYFMLLSRIFNAFLLWNFISW